LTRFYRNDRIGARAVFYSMPENNRNEPVSRSLVFKLALIDGDQALAQESLQILAKHATHDSEPLYASVLMAQQYGTPDMTILALRTLIDQQPPGLNFPALLRCTVRLLMGELDSKDEEKNKSRTVVELVVIFERAAKNTGVLRVGTDEDWQNEIQWWSKTAYNLALKHCEDTIPKMIVRLLAACVHFLDCYPHDRQAGVRHRRLICHFLSATSLVTIARASDKDAKQRRQWYMQARSQINHFNENYEEWQRVAGVTMPWAEREKQGNVLVGQAFKIMQHDLECILHLELWSTLDAAVSKLLEYTGAAHWDNLTDLMFIIHQHAGTATEMDGTSRSRVRALLSKSINETWKHDKDIKKMARLLRQSFNVHLGDGDEDFALSIIRQAASIAKRGFEGKTAPYPSDQLFWLASTAFNKVVDFLERGESAKSGAWTEGALEMARYGDDHGSLHATLTAKKREAEDYLVHGRTNKRRKIE